jgi:protein phosphatase
VSTLVLPDPSLVVLIGAAGSGKSTLAARLFDVHAILSSDALRAAVSGNEADQRASAVAFRILRRMLEQRMGRRELTVVDATNTQGEFRRPLLDRARAAGVPTIALVLDLPPDVIRAQNAGRTNRVVDRAVVDRHIAAIRRTIDGGQLTAEGFDHVVLLRSTHDVATLRVERRRQARPRESATGPARATPG